MTNKILIIDDSEEIGKLEAHAFKNAGFEVHTEKDSKEGLREIASGNYDLVIMDLVMPEKTGFEILNELRKDGSMPPIIVYSNLSANLSREEVLKLGAKDFFDKSNIPLETVVEQASRILSKTSDPQTAE